MESRNRQKCIEDETCHITVRSLLKRVEVSDQPEDKQCSWIFVSVLCGNTLLPGLVCNLVKKATEAADEFLTGIYLSHEIIFFAGEIMINKNRETGCDS